jgi:hypothetical protein
LATKNAGNTERLSVGVPAKPETVNVKRIRTPTPSRGRGTRLGNCVLFSPKKGLTA